MRIYCDRCMKPMEIPEHLVSEAKREKKRLVCCKATMPRHLYPYKYFKAHGRGAPLGDYERHIETITDAIGADPGGSGTATAEPV